MNQTNFTSADKYDGMRGLANDRTSLKQEIDNLKKEKIKETTEGLPFWKKEVLKFLEENKSLRK